MILLYDIVLPHYGASPELTDLCLRCLQSIRTYTDNYRLIFVDNGTPAMEWRDIVSELGLHDNVKTIRNTENAGFIRAVNQGMALATAPYIVLMNNDTEAVPSWTDKLSSAIKGNIAMAGPLTTTSGSWQGTWKPRKPNPFIIQHTAMLAFFCVMIRNSTRREVGYLDESYGVGFGDDDDYCRRVHDAGYKIALVQDLTIPHHHRTTFNTLYDRQQIAAMQKQAMQRFAAT